MKKLQSFILVVIMLFGLSSCGLFSYEGETINNITNKVTEVDDFTINDFQTALQTAIEKAEASAIAIVHTEGGWMGSTSLGSGVVLKREAVLEDESLGEKEGNIISYTYTAVTNRHVVLTTRNTFSTNLKVYVGDGDKVETATCIAYSSKEDLALVTFNSTIYIPEASLGDTTTLKKGTFVVAIGSPYSLEYYGTATLGIVSYPLRYLEDDAFILGREPQGTVTNAYIQHDAAINSGNSGGGLFDIEGKLLGINTQKIQSSAGDIVENMGFSIPIHVILEVFKDYL
ncbi:MAG: trypsin-like peptidase domain-containing protein [Bacilli bacterium]|nr:trypsin-like peptidase domain-containing protein [Bacilli bacterium]